MIALVRTEMTKAVRRSRTIVTALALVALPVLIAVAIHSRGDRPRREGGGEGLFRLARQSGLVVPALVLAVMSGFLLIVVAGMLAGDAVAGDAASGNLRYVLIRPVSRVRLLLAKAFVSGVLIWLSVALVVAAGLATGTVLFGWHPIHVATVIGSAPGGAASLAPTGVAGAFSVIDISAQTLLVRLLEGAAYVAIGYSALLGLGTFFSTLTDSPAGAIGATIGAYIVSEVLDAIPELGRLRYGLPTHYADAWQTMLTQNTVSHDMFAGVGVQVAYLVVFGALAAWWFARKDIRS
ncbi:MAG TPA: ABC transporter permease subunit [Acidimicrobiales bacterium]|nr:ABC transporter permease subunit [Acidimicrobiales bacterium]